MTSVQCSSEYRTDDNQPLAATPDLVDFITGLPEGAPLTPITVDKGNQRDPWPVLVGLRAQWQEQRR
jgi:hypothetical protein